MNIEDKGFPFIFVFSYTVRMVEKLVRICLYAVPIILMIGIIPLVTDEHVLATIYVLCAVVLLATKPEKNDLAAYAFGLVGITISETFFVGTGVETFARQGLFGIMPVWLPFLWAYAFVTIKRTLRILDQ